MTRRGTAIVFLLAASCATGAAGVPDFTTRILPMLTKAGCNSGSCHGAAVGQGSFKLSLLGYDPAQDYVSLTRELGGRRLDLETPTNSLFYRKGTGRLDHDGGRRIREGSETGRALLAWMEADAPFGSGDLHVEEIRVEPADALVSGVHQTIALTVTAALSDGRTEDVTALALYSSNDDSVAEVSSAGLVTTRDRGLTSVMVRYSGHATAARIAVPFGAASGPVDFVPRGFIDELVLIELRRLGLPPSPLSEDAEFFRRVHLDLIGRLPEPGSVRKFLSAPSSDELRREVIASLLDREEFVDFWTLKFGDWLLIGGRRSREAATQAYHDWVRSQIAQNRPLDQFVRDLLVAQGRFSSNGPVNFFGLATDPRDLGEQVGSMFLGVQIACARCHAHPADRWTQEDYHAFAAYFARLDRRGDTIAAGTRGEVEHPGTGNAVPPRPLGGRSTAFSNPDDRRLELAAWLVAPENPFFARNLVNRVWKHLLGRGLVEPVNDLRPTNPAGNPALLDALASEFVRHNYDLRWLVGEIAGSRTYQLSSRTIAGNRRDGQLFSHAHLKPLAAPVFADAVAQVTGVPDQFDGEPDGVRAVQLVGAQTPSHALDVLGRCARDRSCETPGSAGGGLAQALHLINGSTINDKLTGGTLAQLLASGVSDPGLVDELYLRAFGRPADRVERTEWAGRLSRSARRSEAAEDLLWALLNSREFAFNH